MSKELEEIDRQQRNSEHPQHIDNTVFAHSIEQALDTGSGNIDTPLLAQEEIEDEEPPRVNLTAVICTAIVAVCATIILLVAHPWKNSDQQIQSSATHSDTVVRNKENQQAVAKAEPPKKDEQAAKSEQQKQQENSSKEEPAQKVEPKSETVKPQVSTLPILKTTKTGTGNPYNSIRLIDASSRKLTISETEQMSKAELALARNAIYARHGYQFNNPDLKEFFAKQSWFKPSDVKIDAIPFTEIELDNIRIIKAQENK